jgi:hypothetical protein
MRDLYHGNTRKPLDEIYFPAFPMIYDRDTEAALSSPFREIITARVA